MEFFTVFIIKGIFVAIFLFAIKLDFTTWRWWVAMVSLNVMTNI